MPDVYGKKFDYTPAGKKAAAAHKKKKKKKLNPRAQAAANIAKQLNG